MIFGVFDTSTVVFIIFLLCSRVGHFLIFLLLMLPLAAISRRLPVLPPTLNTMTHTSDIRIVHDVVHFVGTLDFVLDAGFEILDTHFAQIGQRWKLFRLNGDLIGIELFLKLCLRLTTHVTSLIRKSILLIIRLTATLCSLLSKRVKLDLTSKRIHFFFKRSYFLLKELTVFSSIKIEPI